MATRENPLSFPVIEVQQKIGVFYIAAVPAETLVKITYKDVRRLAEEQRDVEKYLGIQRPVSPKRMRKIREYLTSPDASFPTGVILAISEKCAEYDPKSQKLNLFEFQPEIGSDDKAIPIGKIAKVLDGQHRLAGFLDENDNWSFDYDEKERFDLNVVLFIGADLDQQANIFATVNLAQTKVSRSLAYDLQGLSKTRSPFRTCHNAAVALDDLEGGPFYERIKRLGVKTKGREGETITQASFVESLVLFISEDPMKDRNLLLAGKKLRKADISELEKVPFRNMFIEGRDLDIAQIVNNYFDAVRERWPNSWKKVTTKGNLLPRTNAFKALMKFLKVRAYVELVGEEFGRIPTSAEFSVFFTHIKMQDSDFTTRAFVPGSGGQSSFFKILTGEIQPSDLFEERK